MVHAICPDILVLGDGSYLIQIHTFIPFSVIHFILRHVMIITEVLTNSFIAWMWLYEYTCKFAPIKFINFEGK